MKINYGTHYDKDYWTGQKRYQESASTVKTYQGPSLTWDGFEIIADTLAYVFPKGSSILDVGCSAGDLAGRLQTRGFDCCGIVVSVYAVEHAVEAMRGRIHVGDITGKELQERITKPFDIVMACDCLEHIYYEDLPQTFQWLSKVAKSHMFFCIATVAFDKDEFVINKGESIPVAYEGVAVSGHVHVRPFAWWLTFFSDHGWKVDWARMYMLQRAREHNPGWRGTPGWNLDATFFLRK